MIRRSPSPGADEVRAWAFEPGEPEESCGLHMVSWAAEGANPQEEVPSRRLVAGEARPNLPIPLRMRLAKRDVTRLYSSLFHVCVDEQGAVTEVRKVAFTSIEVADYLREKVQAWRFDPGPATCTAIVFRHRVSG